MSTLVSIEAGLDNSCCTSQNKTSGALQRRCEYFFADVGSRSQFAADRLGGAIGNGPDLISTLGSDQSLDVGVCSNSPT